MAEAHGAAIVMTGDELAELASLVDEAYQAHEREAEFAKLYKDRRGKIAALMERLGLAIADGQEARAMLARTTEHYIDPVAFLELAGKKKARECCSVILSRAKQVLSPEQYSELERAREADQARLTIRKREEP